MHLDRGAARAHAVRTCSVEATCKGCSAFGAHLRTSVAGLSSLPRPDASAAAQDPARPVPPDDEVRLKPSPVLFWSLSFALTPATWDRVGGFCADYTGYDGEDTDFGWRAAAAGGPLWWVGGAWAAHQHHGPGGPPAQHLHDIVRNAGVFFDRHGSWPMRGWLDGFARSGLAHVDPSTGRWAVTSAKPAPAPPVHVLHRQPVGAGRRRGRHGLRACGSPACRCRSW